MAEKCLKSLLVFHKKKFPKIHDLLELETLLIDLEPDIKEVHQDIILLNRYYIETRYPGDYPEFTFKECKQALESAVRIKEFVFKKMEL
ncbi:HEPN domain-containing protein [Patescibacteria group bacterium AH-259-L07]|nr:HEPN domain-containing protein [Patescibacteria group bacterium AH-259-L07]